MPNSEKTVHKSALSVATREERAEAFYKLFNNMSVLELNNLIEAFSQRFGVNAPVIQVAVTSQQEEVKKEQTEFSVFLISQGPNKIETIKVVKEQILLGLKEAKQLVDSVLALPQLLKNGLTSEAAQMMCKRFTDLGASVKIE